MVSVGGETEVPYTASYFSAHEPRALAAKIAFLVKASGIDGIDIDWEDDWSNANPGMTGYGSSRRAGSGPAIQWLITLTKELRRQLPRPRYTITHAPQAPYFDMGYAKVHAGCGADIDWYNVQYYNQGEEGGSQCSKCS
jgi:chitinase